MDSKKSGGQLKGCPPFFMLFTDLDALAVRAVRGVDCDLVALVDEQRDHDLGAGLERALLEGAGGGGVALYSRLGVGHLECNVCRKLAGEAPLLVNEEHHLDMLSLFHKVGIVNDVLREMDLLISLLMHEVESVLVTIKELVRTSLDADSVDLGTCSKRILENTAVFQITEFGFNESRAFSRFNMLEIHEHARLAVKTHV